MAEMKAAAAAEKVLSPKLKSTSAIFDLEDRDSSLSNSTLLEAVANPSHEGRPCFDEPTINLQLKNSPTLK